jgi:tRNA A37 N6-isopentenylltransferase MiaA
MHALPVTANVHYQTQCCINDAAVWKTVPQIHLRPLPTRTSLCTRVQVISGLLDEAHALKEAGVKSGSSPIARAIGYRQALEWLDEVASAGTADAADVKRLASAIQAASRQLAGSQIKFHRGDEHFKWIDASAKPEALADVVIHYFNSPKHCGALLFLVLCSW